MSAHNDRYGYDHRRMRAAWLESSWDTPCVRCGRPLVRGTQVHLDHSDDDPSKYLGFSHQSCNIASRNRRRARIARQALGEQADPQPTEPAPMPTSREW